MMSKVKASIGPSDDDSKFDRFKPVMTRFYESANPKVEALVKDVREAEAACDKLAVQFGEQAGQTQWEAFFQIFKEFMDMWTDGEANIQKARDAALKEEKRRIAEEKKKNVSIVGLGFVILIICWFRRKRKKLLLNKRQKLEVVELLTSCLMNLLLQIRRPSWSKSRLEDKNQKERPWPTSQAGSQINKIVFFQGK
jgi:hypothetical protein